MRITRKFIKTFNRFAEKAERNNCFSFKIGIGKNLFEVCPVTNELYGNGKLILNNKDWKSLVNFFLRQFNTSELGNAKFVIL